MQTAQHAQRDKSVDLVQGWKTCFAARLHTRKDVEFDLELLAVAQGLGQASSGTAPPSLDSRR